MPNGTTITAREAQLSEGRLAGFDSLRAFLLRFSFCDWLVLCYLSNLNLLVLLAPDSPQRNQSLAQFGGLGAFFLTSVLAVRSGLLSRGWFGPMLYRLAHFSAAIGSYLLFAGYLPIVNQTSVDGGLYSLDLALFGKEPAIVFDAFVSPWTTEWFSFFYYSYFLLLALHVIPILFFGKHPRLLAHFAAGMILVACVGQTLYIVVPGYGPTVSLPEAFEHTLPAGIWWNAVSNIVATSGAHKDIFPSLHTAFPLFVLLFSFDNRDHLPYRYSWPFLAFFVANIIVATMFLRWHYVIDVVAGLLLALGAHYLARGLSAWEPRRRAELGTGPVWPPYT